jgi:hypothetical protein
MTALWTVTFSLYNPPHLKPELVFLLGFIDLKVCIYNLTFNVSSKKGSRNEFPRLLRASRLQIYMGPKESGFY